MDRYFPAPHIHSVGHSSGCNRNALRDGSVSYAQFGAGADTDTHVRPEADSNTDPNGDAHPDAYRDANTDTYFYTDPVAYSNRHNGGPTGPTVPGLTHFDDCGESEDWNCCVPL